MLKAIIVTCAFIGISGAADPPNPVDTLDVRMYLGNYYQMYSNKFALDTTQPNNSTCATIQYGMVDQNTVSVDNRYRQFSATGDLDRTTGRAMLTSTTGVLDVVFDGIPGNFSYRVFMLGPMVQGRYAYAAITDNSMNSLFVIARDPAMFRSDYETDVLAALTNLGFTGALAPIATYQDSDCIYPKSFMEPTPVSSLDVDAYLGNWCQMYANKNTIDQSQPNSVCATISYAKINSTAVSVDNRYSENTPGGRVDITTGTALLTDTPGVLNVFFDKVPSPVPFSYIVTKLGDKVDGQYEYAVVSDRNKFSLFVLVRDCINLLDEVTEEMILDYLEDDLGFDGLTNSPVKTYQGTDCPYSFDVSGAGTLTWSIGLAFIVSILHGFL